MSIFTNNKILFVFSSSINKFYNIYEIGPVIYIIYNFINIIFYNIQMIEKLESHNISFYNSDNFYFFYYKVVSDTIFYRIPTDNLENYLEKNKLLEYNVIYQNANTTIIYLNPYLEKYISQIYVAPDPIDKHRYFVGIGFLGGYTAVYITGLFVYFDSQGNVTNKMIIPKILYNHDYRNGIIDEKSTILYNQTLVILVSHRDTGSFIITICCFDYDDIIKGIYTNFTDIKSNYFDKNFIVKNNRWLVFLPEEKNYYNKEHDKEKSINIIDLGSVEVIIYNPDDLLYSNNVKYKMNYSTYKYKIDNQNEYQKNLDNYLFELYRKPGKKYSDYYPNDCIKCGNLDGSAIFYHKNMSLGLGKSYCHDCGIRFSYSENCWQCSKIKNYSESDFKFCSQKLTSDNNYNCDKIHCDVELIYEYKIKEYKPYKKDGSVRIKENNFSIN